MKFTRLDISNKILTRQDFISQPRKLFILPDNLPDFRLPRHKLHDTNNRGGLATAMRPNRIGGTDLHPIYDVNIVGIPTLSFDTSENLSVRHIVEGFANIYRLMNSGEFDEIVVPYKGGKPAFGGGVAGPIPATIRNAIEEEFDRLAAFCSTKKVPNDFPGDYLKAYREGSLSIAKNSREKVSSYFNDRFPRLAFFTQGTVAVGAAYGTYAALAGFLAPMFLGAAILVASLFAVVTYRFMLKTFFGEKKLAVQLNKEGVASVKKLECSGNLAKSFGIDAPYKKTLSELEAELKQLLQENHLKSPVESQKQYDERITKLVKFNAKQVVVANAEASFYEADIQRVKTAEYAVAIPKKRPSL